MAKFIDANDLIERIEDVLSRREHRQAEVPSWLQKIIDELPTVFDVEKVVEELERQAEQERNRGFEFEQKGYSAMADKYYGKYCSYEYATEIVRRGGVE